MKSLKKISKTTKAISKATHKLSEFNEKVSQTAETELANLRTIINKLDDMIIQAIARRMIVSQTIGTIKKQHNIKIKDQKRENELQKFHLQLAKKHNITHKTLQKIFTLIMEESKRLQRKK